MDMVRIATQAGDSLMMLHDLIAGGVAPKRADYGRISQTADFTGNIEDDRAFPLDSVLKNQFETAFAADMSHVVIHVGEYADQRARQAGAQAIAIGNDIYFAQGKYAPHTEDGIALLSHELQHVVQRQRPHKLLYSEDLLDLETEALEAESLIERMRLHAITAPVLDSSAGESFAQIERAEAIKASSQESPGRGNSTPMSLESFSGRSKGRRIELTLSDGTVVGMTVQEYESYLDQTKRVLQEYLEEQQMSMTREGFEQLMLKFYQFARRRARSA